MAGEDRAAGARGVALVSIAFDIFLAVAKLAAGIVGQSMAMLADALHSLVDIGCSLVVAVSVSLASRPPDRTHPYGHGKVETVGTGVLGIILVVAGFRLGYEGVIRVFADSGGIPGVVALWVAGGSLVVKEALYRYVRSVGDRIKSSTVRAHAWHHRTDAMTSLAALVGVGAARYGFTSLDPLVAALIAVVIVRGGLSFAWSALQELLDAAPSADLLEKISRAAMGVPGVEQVADVRVRRYGPGLHVDLVACIREEMSLLDGHKMIHLVEEAVRWDVRQVKEVDVHLHPCRETGSGCDAVCEQPLDIGSV